MSPQIIFRTNLLILIIFAANTFVFALPDGRVSLIDYLIGVYLWLCWVFAVAWGLAVSRDYSLVHRILIAVASIIAEHSL